MRAGLGLCALGGGGGWLLQWLSWKVWTDPQIVLWEMLLAQAALLVMAWMVARVLGGELLRPVRAAARADREEDPLRYRFEGDAPGW